MMTEDEARKICSDHGSDWCFCANGFGEYEIYQRVPDVVTRFIYFSVEDRALHKPMKLIKVQ